MSKPIIDHVWELFEGSNSRQSYDQVKSSNKTQPGLFQFYIVIKEHRKCINTPKTEYTDSH